MKMKKRGLFLPVCMGAAVLLSGCSMNDVIDTVTGKVSETIEKTTTDEDSEPLESKNVDDSLETPVFDADIYGVMNVVVDSPLNISSPATVSDGGEITYQWYVNNVESNGGGTAIEGATDAVLDLDTSEIGTEFYYVVATNNQGDSIAMATSNTRGIVVWERGDWAPDENGGYRYVNQNGTYPTETWLELDGETYYFDVNGDRCCNGWITLGENTFYFDEEGRLLRDTETPDGHHVDAGGVQID